MDVILYGTKGEKLELYYERGNGRGVLEQPFEGVLNNLERRLRETQSDGDAQGAGGAAWPSSPARTATATGSDGRRPAVTVGGMSITDFCRHARHRSAGVHERPDAGGRNRPSSPSGILKEIRARLGFLQNVGLQLSDAGPGRGHALRRREPAHPPGHADRLEPHGRALYPRRAVHRPAPARQRQAPRHPASTCATSATRSSSSSTTRTPCAPQTRSSTSAPARASTAGEIVAAGYAGGHHGRAPSPLTGQYLSGKRRTSPSRRERRHGQRERPDASSAARENNLQGHRRGHPARHASPASPACPAPASRSLVNEIIYKKLAVAR